jgi:hypothetical protein
MTNMQFGWLLTVVSQCSTSMQVHLRMFPIPPSFLIVFTILLQILSTTTDGIGLNPLPPLPTIFF